MSEQSKNSNIGDDIGKFVQDAITSVDYEQLGTMISGTVDRALAEAKKGIKMGQYQVEKSIKAARVAAGSGAQAQNKPKPVRAPVAKSPAGTVSGPLCIAGASVALISAGMAAVTGLFTAAMVVQGLAVGLLGLSGFFFAKGRSLMSRVSRFKQYVKTLNGRAYVDTTELADSIGKSKKYVAKDLDKMIDARMFPEGRLENGGTVLLLSNEASEAYNQMMEGQRLKEQEAKEKAEAEAEQRRLEAQNPVYKELRLVIEEGEDTIRQIREANDAIPEESVSQKLTRLETVIRKIFDFIRTNPGQIMETRRFMGYYLPTTLKLVNAYKDLDAQPVQGPNIVKAKKEIEETLDTISGAFEKLLDSFYQDTAMDISSDISAMKTMFAQEGLTGSSSPFSGGSPEK
jgi:5-bromo-4-chloroindolyl phosphate hydrolysis protein